jgi:arsenate reductase-like glutaredoxin family protein
MNKYEFVIKLLDKGLNRDEALQFLKEVDGQEAATAVSESEDKWREVNANNPLTEADFGKEVQLMNGQTTWIKYYQQDGQRVVTTNGSLYYLDGAGLNLASPITHVKVKL